MNTELIGYDELLRSIKGLETLPQKVASRAAREGGKIELAAARAMAPVDTGLLRKGLKIVGEKASTKGRKVYQVVFDRAYNDVFVKNSKSGDRYYYPASQEFGFKTRGGGYVPGYHFLEKSMSDKGPLIERTIVNGFIREIDKIWEEKA